MVATMRFSNEELPNYQSFMATFKVCCMASNISSTTNSIALFEVVSNIETRNSQVENIINSK